MNTSQINKNNLLNTIDGYGFVVGLPEGRQCYLLGSLSAITALLAVLKDARNPTLTPLSAQAASTLAAINAREKINGTEAERRNPGRFQELTDTARSELSKMRQAVLKQSF